MCADGGLLSPSQMPRKWSVIISPVMAIYHMNAMVISRGSGGSAVAASAYRSGENIEDERTGETHDYARRSGVDGTEIIAPDGAGDWVRDRDRLWNAAESAEKRKDSQVAREVRVALPSELDPEQRRELVRDFASREFVERGMVADVAYHGGGGENPHAHIMLTTRTLTAEGFGAKDRSWNSKELLAEWREQWADHANRALERAGSRERIDHRTLAEQRQEAIERGQLDRAEKLDRDPQIHLGKASSALRRRGEGNERTRRNDRICAGNRARDQKRSRLRRSIQALDRAIRAERIRIVVQRGSSWTSKQVKAGAAWVREIPRRRQEAAEARVQLKAERAMAAVESGQQWPETKDQAGAAPLHYAAAAGRDDMVDRLIKDGASTQTYDKTGATPLHRAAAAGHAQTIERLITAGAHVNSSDHARVTPLHRAVEKGSADSTRALLKYGADPHAPDYTGRTPATMAEAAGRQDIVKLFHDADTKRAQFRAERAQRTADVVAKRAAAKVAEDAQLKAEADRVAAEQQRAAVEARRIEQKRAEAAQIQLEAMREKNALGRAAFVRSLDPNTAKDQTRGEVALAKDWKKQNSWEAWKIERAHPKQQRGPERDSGYRPR